MITISKCHPYSTFSMECFDYFMDYNNGRRPVFEYGTDLFTVHNGTREVGVFTVEVLTDGSEITCSFWAHPRTCKMGLLAIQKAAAVHCYTRALKERIELVTIKFKDRLSCRTIKRICPGFVEHDICKGYYLCVCGLEDIQDIYKVDKDYCFSLDI